MHDIITINSDLYHRIYHICINLQGAQLVHVIDGDCIELTILNTITSLVEWCVNVKALSYLSRQARWGFLCAWIFQHTEKFLRANRYFASFVCISWVRCEVLACPLWAFYATCVPQAWKLHVRYGQHMCTVRYGHVNSVVNVRELRTRCKTAWTYKNESFPQYLQAIYQYWEIKMISRYCKNLYGFIDAGNYSPILENTE